MSGIPCSRPSGRNDLTKPAPAPSPDGAGTVCDMVMRWGIFAPFLPPPDAAFSVTAPFRLRDERYNVVPRVTPSRRAGFGAI